MKAEEEACPDWREGLVHCYRCDACYDGGATFGYYARSMGDTSGQRGRLILSVAPGHCPKCFKPPRLEPYPTVQPM